MHSSRMHTVHGSSRPQKGGYLPQCMLGYTSPGCMSWDPPGVSLETPQVWAWRPPQPDPSTSPLVWAWRPSLETCCKACWDTTYKACWDTTPPPPGDLLQGMLGYHLQCMLGYHPPMNRMTDRCKNITLPQTLRVVKRWPPKAAT